MKKLKVLIAEDIMSIQDIYKRMLSEDIFEKRFADNGREALKIYKSWSPDIVLLDVKMPVMTGDAVLNEIRKNIGDTSTPIIMQTTIADKKNILQFVKLGIQGYIVKPFEPDQVTKKILQCYESTNSERSKAAQAVLDEESKYLEELRICFEEGNISDDERRLLERKREKLGISEEWGMKLENIAKAGKAPQYSAEELEYIDELKFCLETGSISDDERKMLNRTRDKLKIPEKRATEIEEGIAKSEKAPQYSAEELEYIDELKSCLESGSISDDERNLLNRKRDKLKIPEARAIELEKEVTK
ncbi:MAG: response regulator [Thermodesulfobacteriota bacterium]|nr:response regulator [Thermodesulfobacteriota bacterium]